jgi:hypothetical protein
MGGVRRASWQVAGVNGLVGRFLQPTACFRFGKNINGFIGINFQMIPILAANSCLRGLKFFAFAAISGQSEFL